MRCLQKCAFILLFSLISFISKAQDINTEDTSLRPVIVLKSNLLYDAASLINVELEYPIGSRYSLVGEYVFPWWKSERNDVTIQMLQGGLEGRYWLGDRSRRPLLTGWFAGVYMGAGYYDFQLGGDGVQGEFFIMGGLSAGFAHRISRHLSLEYSIGVGYLQTDYREYWPADSPEYGHIKVREYPYPERRQTWIGPTKAKVSLCWSFGTKKKGDNR